MQGCGGCFWRGGRLWGSGCGFSAPSRGKKKFLPQEGYSLNSERDAVDVCGGVFLPILPFPLSKLGRGFIPPSSGGGQTSLCGAWQPPIILTKAIRACSEVGELPAHQRPAEPSGKGTPSPHISRAFPMVSIAWTASTKFSPWEISVHVENQRKIRKPHTHTHTHPHEVLGF